MKLNNRFIFGILSLVLAAVIAFVALPTIARQTNGKTEIVRITKAGGVEVVDHPEVAAEQSSPRTVFDSALGFVVGTILASLVLVMRMLSDTTIYLPEDIEKLTGMTVLGQIPDINVTDKSYTYWELTEGGTARNEAEESKQQGGK